METKANYALVGFFTLLVIAAAFGFVYWMTQYGRSGTMVQLEIRIPGSANGLSVGSPVRFNGIPVGTVTELLIDAEDPTFSQAMTQVREDAPIYTSTKAILEIQGLTGAAFVELSGGNTSEDNILQKAREENKIAVILAEQSSVTNLLATADDIMKKANSAIGDIQSFTSQSRQPLTNTVKNAERFSEALTRNADGIDTFLKSVSALSSTITGLSGRLDGTLASVQKLVDAVDPQKVNQIVTNATQVSKDLADTTGQLKGTVESFQKTAQSFAKFGDDATKSLARVDRILASVDPAKVGTSVDDIAAASKDARLAIADFKALSASISARQKDIDQTITDVTEMSATLNKASVKVDGVLSKVDGLLGSGDANSLFAEAKATLESYRQVAATLNAKIGPIADSLARFSSGGLRDVQSLVSDTRRTVQNLDEAISNFDKNPQRLLFGGETVKQFDGRTRR